MPRVIYKSSVLLYFLFSYAAIQAQCNLSIDVPDDITICDPQNIDLIGSISGNYLDFFWEGDNGFFDNLNLNTQDLAQTTTTYTLNARTESNTNLIFNGDFELGNTGFTTQYAHSDPIVTCGSGNHV